MQFGCSTTLAALETAMHVPRSRLAMFCLVPTILFLTTGESRGWSAEGHMIVALVADRLLQAQDAAAHKKLTELLATDKSNSWTKTDIAGEANWADVLLEKSPEGRAATAKWHYVKLDAANPDLTKACFGKPALPFMAPASRGVQDDCVVDKIEQFAKELRDPATLPGERLTALQFLLNFVGDVNDPLFAIEQNDQGGRCVALIFPAAKTPVQIVAGLTPADIQKWSSGSPADWAMESYNVAKEVTYSFAKDKPKDSASKYSFPARKGEKDPCGPVPLYQVDAGYRERAVAAVKEQLAKAGVRLAFLLRENLQ